MHTFSLGFTVSEALLEDDSLIVQGAFTKLLHPGLVNALIAEHNPDVVSEALDHSFWRDIWNSENSSKFTRSTQPLLPSPPSNSTETNMPIVQPNTSQAAKWRLNPRRREYPIEAWRGWALTDDEPPQLRSLAVNVTPWHGPVVRSHRRPYDVQEWERIKTEYTGYRRHEELTDAYHCGIYAVKAEAVNNLLAGYNPTVFGLVDLWGRVAEFERGYRAEFCMVKNLLMFHQHGKTYVEDQRIADALSRRYDCPVTLKSRGSCHASVNDFLGQRP